MTREEAEALAVEALGFVAGNAELLERFLRLSGIDPQGIRTAAREPGFLAGVLQFLLAHEPTLLLFAESAEIKPQAVSTALQALPFGGDRYERSV